MAKANNETKATALLLSFSAAALFLLARAVLPQPTDRRPGGALADLLLAALDRLLDGRGLLHLATRRNMVLLCHAILLVILRDAGVLGAPAARRRGAAASTASVVVAPAADADAAAAPVLTDAAGPERSIVLWRRPQQDAHAGGSGRRLVRPRRQPRRSAAQQHPAAAAPRSAEQPEQHQPHLASEEIVLVEKAPRSYLLLLDDDRDHDRAPTCASAADGEERGLDRRVVVVPRDERNANAVTSEQVELADDRRIEEFIARQRSKMWQESVQLERSSASQLAVAAR